VELLRLTDHKHLKNLFKSFNCVAILGPRQCGKTTLARQFSKNIKNHTFLDLEDPNDLAKLANPMLFMSSLEGYLIIDEIQRQPDLFPVLRVILDKKPLKLKILILGSASRDLIRQSSETLAGRIAYLELNGLGLKYFSKDSIRKHWLRGQFPSSFLAKSELNSVNWRKQYIRTFLETDIPNLGINIPPRILRQFWTMLAHLHGQTFNASELASNFGVSHTTIKKYTDILAGTYMLRVLEPWFINISKRVKKSPKIYIRDSGILHSLLGLTNYNDLIGHPKLGASWEGYAMEQIIDFMGLESDEVYYWGLHSGAEIDFLYMKNSKFHGIEFKFADKPKLTPSMLSAMQHLDLDSLSIVHPNKDSYQLDKKIFVRSIEEFTA